MRYPKGEERNLVFPFVNTANIKLPSFVWLILFKTIEKVTIYIVYNVVCKTIKHIKHQIYVCIIIKKSLKGKQEFFMEIEIPNSCR